MYFTKKLLVKTHAEYYSRVLIGAVKIMDKEW